MKFEASLKEDEGTLYKICVTFTRIRPIAECVDFFLDMMRLSMRWLNYKEIDGLFCDVNMRKTLDEHRLVCILLSGICFEKRFTLKF